MSHKFQDVLNSFDPITLSQMDGVKLLDRIDTKFMFTEEMLPEILKAVNRDYYVLDISGLRSGNYETLYYDTLDYGLYTQHQNGKLNRYKFRCRKYVESNLHFFEIKFKNSKGRTIKDRIKRPDFVYDINDKPAQMVNSIDGFKAENLKPKIWINYNRITLVNKHSQERLTIDTNLTFIQGNEKKIIDNLVIAEVKQGKASDVSPFIAMMKKMGIRENSISKYCYGVISMNPDIKQNRFKPIILYINKLLRQNERSIFS